LSGLSLIILIVKERNDMRTQTTFIAHMLVGVLMGLMLSSGAFAQVDRGRLLGTITDPSGAVVPGAKVAVVSLATAQQYTVTSDSNGIYQVPNLPVGHYSVAVSRNGFSTTKLGDVQINVGQNLTLNLSLKVGAPVQTVTVKGTATPLEQTTPAADNVVQSQEIQQIPLNGRNWSGLAMLSPLSTGNSTRSMRFGGRAPDDNGLTLDGVELTGIQEHPQKSNQNLTVSTEAIAEYKVSTTLYTAEYGGAAAGGQINIVTKSGSNQFHGDAFDYIRNSKFDARAPFDPSTLPPLHRNQFGGAMGGPIQKDRTFFFGSYEAVRQSTGSTETAFIPSQTFLDTVAATSPVLSPLLGYWPSPNPSLGAVTATSDPNALLYRVVRHGSDIENSFDGRVDHIFSERTTMYGRFDMDRSGTASTDALGQIDSVPQHQVNATLTLDHTFSGSLINEAKIGVNRSTFTELLDSPSPYNIDIPGLDSVSRKGGYGVENGTSYAGIDNLTYIRGRHTFKFGTEFRRIQLNQGIEGDQTLSYNSETDFINNVVEEFDYHSPEDVMGFRRNYWFAYAQDEFKMRPNLTFNFGLRHEYYSVAHDVYGRGKMFDMSCGGYCPPGTPWYSPAPYNLDPRLGMAWSPGMFHGKTVVRLGFGVYHGDGQNDDLNAPLESTETAATLTSTDTPGLTYPVAPFLAAALAAQTNITPRGLQRDRQDLYQMAFGGSIQTELPNDFVLEVGYFGNLGRQVFYRTYVNVIDPTTGQRPLPNFSQVDYKPNEGVSNYSAFHVALKRHFTRGWLWNVQYAWSHSINDGGVGGGEAASPEIVSCVACNYGNSNDDFRHHLVFDTVYELPFGSGKRFLASGSTLAKGVLGGWQLSAIGVFSSGGPVNIVVNRSSGDLPDGNSRNQRPDLVPGVSPYPAGGQLLGGQWLNRAAFVVPAPGTWGNVGKNTFRGPGFWSTDLALQKSFQMTESLLLDFRAEAFNLFNHSRFANPDNNISHSSFGQILEAGGPARIMEFAMRLRF
jgi:Carboxypeptidase regulatory-like domain/TonB dependent receptor-like, beta-barrel